MVEGENSAPSIDMHQVERKEKIHQCSEEKNSQMDAGTREIDCVEERAEHRGGYRDKADEQLTIDLPSAGG
jgi:hypothetical protein